MGDEPQSVLRRGEFRRAGNDSVPADHDPALPRRPRIGPEAESRRASRRMITGRRFVSSPRSGWKRKAWGASPRFVMNIITRAREAGGSLSPAVAGSIGISIA